MATLKQIEANRRNAQKSTGPRTEAGKEVARRNALKHGMRSSDFFILPSEDPAEFADHLDAWIQDYQPTDDAEVQLVTHAVTLTWKIDRANRHEAAILARQVRAVIEPIRYRRREWVTGAIDRLLPSVDRAERHGIEPAAQLVADFEQTAEGCRRLLEEWQLLRRILLNPTPWSPNREFTAMRLLGQGPGIIDDPEAVAIIIAARVLRGIAEGVETDPDQWALEKRLRVAVDREVVRELWENRPKDAAEALPHLLIVTEREIARLEALMAEREGQFDPEMAEAADLVSFDPSPEGERIRRHLASLQRELLKTLDTIGKRRQQAVKLRLDEAKLQKLTNEANSTGASVEEGDLRSAVSAGSGDPCRADNGTNESSCPGSTPDPMKVSASTRPLNRGLSEQAISAGAGVEEGDLRSAVSAGSGDPRRADGDTIEAVSAGSGDPRRVEKCANEAILAGSGDSQRVELGLLVSRCD